MARPTELSYPRVAAAADAMRAAGMEPTVKALLAQLGGSPNTILPFYQLWKAQAGPAPAPKIAAVLTPEIVAGLEAWANGVLALAQKGSDALVSAQQAARVAAEDSAAERGAQLESTLGSLKELEQSLRQRDDQLITAQNEIGRLGGVVAELEREKTTARGDLEAARRDVVEGRHRAELAEQRVQLMEALGTSANVRGRDIATRRGTTGKASSSAA